MATERKADRMLEKKYLGNGQLRDRKMTGVL
jgi:hypothetical protein